MIGHVPQGSEIGEGSVVIGATDAHGNAIFTTPGAFGFGAKAGAGSIAVGAFAGACASQLLFPEKIREELLALTAFAKEQRHDQALAALKDISAELSKQTPEPSTIHRAWGGIQALATIDGAHNLLTKGAAALFSYLQGTG